MENKTINLFLDMEFTSLSPNAQIISIGIVSDFIVNSNALYESKDDSIIGCLYVGDNVFTPKTFYAEFTDFNLNRCDDWVKENVVDKLKHYGSIKTLVPDPNDLSGNMDVMDDTKNIKLWLETWLSQLSDYDIQFVVDCGTWDWFHFLPLIAEWDCVRTNRDKATPLDSLYKEVNGDYPIQYFIGLPKLPDNISPVPFDLNDLIAIKKGIMPKEAFDINREEFGCMVEVSDQAEYWGKSGKHNALWDAKVIKEIYNKLK